jgi:hypothetical protein
MRRYVSSEVHTVTGLQLLAHASRTGYASRPIMLTTFRHTKFHTIDLSSCFGYIHILPCSLAFWELFIMFFCYLFVIPFLPSTFIYKMLSLSLFFYFFLQIHCSFQFRQRRKRAQLCDQVPQALGQWNLYCSVKLSM